MHVVMSFNLRFPERSAASRAAGKYYHLASQKRSACKGRLRYPQVPLTFAETSFVLSMTFIELAF